MLTLAAALQVPVGLSDNGRGLPSAIAAVALGASVYERHLMLEGDTEAIDAAVSSTPSELRTIVQAMEETRLALGTGRKACQRVEAPNVIPSRRGLYARRAIRAGDFVNDADVIALRPASALAPADLPRLVGSALPRDLAAGEPFQTTDLALERAS